MQTLMQAPPAGARVTEFVTVSVGTHLFGVPIGRVQDVFVPERITRVPLAPAQVAGVLNLRGRIVTALDMRRRLGMPPAEGEGARMAVGVDAQGESYGLLVDSVGEVLALADAGRNVNPVNLDATLARVSAGVYRLDGKLLVILDVDRIVEIEGAALAA